MKRFNFGIVGVSLSLLALAVFLHFWKVESLPPGFYYDESSIGYNAYCIATTGADEYGVRQPLFFRSFGNYHDPVMIYFLAPLIKAFGLKKSTVRFPSALFHILAAVVFACLVKEHTRNPYLGVISAFIFSVLPWGFPISRSLMAGYSAMLFGMCLGWFSILKAFRTRSKKWAILSATSWAFTMYTHNIGRPMTVILLICFGICFFRPVLRRWKIGMAFTASFLIILIPLILHSFTSTKSLTNRFNSISVWQDNTDVKTVLFRAIDRYLDYFSPNF